MKRTTFAAVAAVALLALCGAAGGCGNEDGDDSKVCDTGILEPAHLVIKKGGGDVQIATKTASQCDLENVTMHIVEVHLERQVKGQWTDDPMMLGGGGVNTCTELPKPGQTIYCPVTFDGCISGIWRTRATVEWERRDAKLNHAEGKFEVPEMYPQKIKCPGPRS